MNALAEIENDEIGPLGRKPGDVEGLRFEALSAFYDERWNDLKTIANILSDIEKGRPVVFTSLHQKRQIKRARLHIQSDKCFFCGIELTEDTATLDHKIPSVRGGSDHRANLVACCSPCNHAKDRMTVDEFNRHRDSAK